MSLFEQAMTYYPYVFHPITVLGVGYLVLIYYEWSGSDAGRSSLYRRLGVFLAAGALSLVPSAVFFFGLGRNVMETTQGNAWPVDTVVAAGLLIVGAITWYAWRHFEWGRLVPGASVALVAVTIPYAALSPFWNVSGHVIIALMPAYYLTLVDRRFWPTLAIPAIMVPNRIVLDAHTWPQTLWAVPFTVLVVTVAYWYVVDPVSPSASGPSRRRDDRRSESQVNRKSTRDS